LLSHLSSLPHLPPRSTLFPYTTLFRSLFGELVPLVLVHEEAESRAVEAAGEERRVLHHAVQLERDDRLEREEHPVGDSGGQQLRSEEHTSELQSLAYLVCRLLLEKKKR